MKPIDQLRQENKIKTFGKPMRSEIFFNPESSQKLIQEKSRQTSGS